MRFKQRQREPLQPPTVSGHGLSSVSIAPRVMQLVDAKKEAERANCPPDYCGNSRNFR